jgi:hypothetical protein
MRLGKPAPHPTTEYRWDNEGGAPVDHGPAGRMRAGASALGISALLFAAFPLVRPFSRSFQDDPAAFARNVVSSAWLLSHLLGMLALVLLPLGSLALYAALVSVVEAPRSPSSHAASATAECCRRGWGRGTRALEGIID